jgi:hypothetical protein
MDTQERIDTGSDPAEARREAHRDFGNVVQISEDTRAAWSGQSPNNGFRTCVTACATCGSRPALPWLAC